MSKLATWYRDKGEYVIGGLFALVALDLYMYFAHIVLEQSFTNYDLKTLLISGGLLTVALIERSYSKSEQH